MYPATASFTLLLSAFRLLKGHNLFSAQGEKKLTARGSSAIIFLRGDPVPPGVGVISCGPQSFFEFASAAFRVLAPAGLPTFFGNLVHLLLGDPV
jgi:hypothetical protein